MLVLVNSTHITKARKKANKIIKTARIVEIMGIAKIVGTAGTGENSKYLETNFI